MTSNRARHELIQLPTIIKVRLLGTRRHSGTVPVPVPDLAGDGDAPPSPSPICPESGTLPRPRPRFAEIGDQAVVLEYPKGVEGLAQVWSHNSRADNSQNWSTLSRHTHLSYLASDSAFDEEKARNGAFQPGQFEPPWERWLKLDPLFAGCLPSKPLAS